MIDHEEKSTEMLVNHGQIIASIAVNHDKEMPTVRHWQYARVGMAFTPTGPTREVCVDSGCSVTLVDRNFLLENHPQAVLRATTIPINVRGIGAHACKCTEYTSIPFYIPGEKNGKPLIAHFTRYAYVVDNLKANMLIGVDVLAPEDMEINFRMRRLTIGSCGGISAKINLSPKLGRTKRIVLAKEPTTIPAKSFRRVQVSLRGKTPLPVDRDLLFAPLNSPTNAGIQAHLVDAEFYFVNVENPTEDPLVIPRKMRLGIITDYQEEGCYYVEPENASLAVNPPSSRDPTVEVPETKLPNGVTVYGNNQVYQRIQSLVEKYPNLWKDTGKTADVPESEYMSIPLVDDWQAKGRFAAKVYPLSPKDKAAVDAVFDELHAQGRMEWTKEATPFASPVFVVWKTVFMGPDKVPTRKSRVVVDIRGLNQISVTDSYPLPLQSDIIAAVRGSRYISTLDCTGFFYQWRVKPSDVPKLTVVSHRGQESFRVAVMGYKNSPPYVQRQMDTMLRPHRNYAKGYIDDVVVFSMTLEDHLKHLEEIFQLFNRLNIALKPTKSYLSYPSITLLGQRVDALGLSTTEEKIAAITQLKFPETLKDLETYLGLTGWLRCYIPEYAQRAEPLQRRKTLLLQNSPAKSGNPRKYYARSTPITERTRDELEAFKDLQNAFKSPRFLHHHDPNRRLYIDLDASKRKGFGAMLYHVRGDPTGEAKEIKRQDVQPIMFLSRLLNQAETRN